MSDRGRPAAGAVRHELAGYLRDRMDDLGIVSIRGLAARVGVAPETARRLLAGTSAPDEATLRKLAEGLPASLPMLRRMSGRPSGTGTPFRLPPEADQLDARQRSVIVSMVHALLAASSTERPRNGVGSDKLRLAGRPRNPNSSAE